ncbi:MAG: hypothetical protein M3N21_07700, partial [Actinomycetota bacterium]|nr:hypothetical protein [Actinomycetota bacterium]
MRIRSAVAVTLTAALLSGGGLVAVTAAGASASPAVAAGRAAKHPLLDARHRAELRRTGHTLVVRHTRKHGDVTVLVQRGIVMDVSATAITLRSKDGYAHTYVINDATKVVDKRVRVSATALHVGERAMVVGVRGAAGDVARRVSC